MYATMNGIICMWQFDSKRIENSDKWGGKTHKCLTFGSFAKDSGIGPDI